MAGYNRVADIDRGWRERLARIQMGQWGVTVGVIGAAASRVHPPEQTLDKRTENFLVSNAAKGNADAASQLDAMRSADASRRFNHVFKPGPTMAELGEIFEFGLGNNPERSWLRGYVDENQAKTEKKLTRIAEKVYQGEMSPEAGLDLLGLSIVGGIKRRIQAFIPPPLAASTLAKKGPNKTTPLINTAQWIGSISHVVELRDAAKAREGSV